MSTNEPYPGTQAVLRALALLKTFSDEQPELNLVELAQAVDLNKTTAYRLLTALESEGLVTRTPEADAYRLGAEAIALGGRAIRANSLHKVGRPELEALARQTKETATMEILSGEQSLTLDEISGSYVVGVSRYIGTRWPLHATATGKVLLAHLPPAQLDGVLAVPLTGYTPHTITDAASLRQALTHIREQGYAVGNEELEIGFVSVGAPIRNHDGVVVAAIGTGGSSARLSREIVDELVDQVMISAQRVSEQLGYRESSESKGSERQSLL